MYSEKLFFVATVVMPFMFFIANNLLYKKTIDRKTYITKFFYAFKSV